MKNKETIIREFNTEDKYKPSYHFSSPYGWLNDPNGTVFWKGRWHLFYQYAPDIWKTGRSIAHWAHAVSDDLVHWKDLPIALAPEPGTYDEKGCWSGTSIVDGDCVIANYHAHQGGNCIAISRDEMLLDWQKSSSNPFVRFDPEKTYDPCIWKNNGIYYSISGRITGAKYGDGRDQEFGGKDIAYIYKSMNLTDWEYTGVFYEGGVYTRPGEDCACPDFFEINGKYMLLFLSHNQGAQYYLGQIINEKFIPETHGRMNFTAPGLWDLGISGDLAAPIAWVGPNDRRVFIGWITEGRNREAMKEFGWAGIMSLPRDMSLDDNGCLLISPIPELNSLRTNHRSVTELQLIDGIYTELYDINNNTNEIGLSIDRKDSTHIYIEICVSKDLQEKTIIEYDNEKKQLILNPSSSSIDVNVTGRSSQIAPLILSDGESLDLRIYTDNSVVEVFANGRQCVTKRIYPKLSDSTSIRFKSVGSNAIITSLNIWDMKSIW